MTFYILLFCNLTCTPSFIHSGVTQQRAMAGRADGVIAGTISCWGTWKPQNRSLWMQRPSTTGARLLLGKAEMQVQALGCALLPSTPLRRAPIMPEQHPGSGTPSRYVWAQAHLLSAQGSTPWWWCWQSLAVVRCPWQWAGRRKSPPGGWRFLPDLLRASENAKERLM